MGNITKFTSSIPTSMSRYFIYFYLLLLVFSFGTTKAQQPNPHYDAALADSLGADDYGMKSYIFAILKTGPETEPDDEKRAELFRGHMNNIGRLVESGEMIVAGPFGKNDLTYRGLFILNVESVEMAEDLMKTDPAMAAGLFEVELIPWYGSAALPAYIETHRKIEKMQP